ncbi:FKBP-type peptidyl-prolyl cis-trans isomerase [Marivirga sp.]|uniref:FKBP-type peptidyl-prolyl cis-trans isomerase n=1 Tax=Marivirga sp. TaxID=2018662 RepID=UPI002D808EB2|nr:FKBP-type peptidyl-prolyl cis-trans isomerase [Marivirga sp.]HET8861384.1 FKBP-type peptidyl-prolyl cis-trans isomerase [Marivirga sp.]
MLKIKYLMFLGLSLALFSSCEDECENLRGECSDEQLNKDITEIEKYLEDNNLTAEKLNAYELYYIIHEEGTGPNAENRQEVSVNYTGRFLNGDVFDTSIEAVAKEEGTFSETRTYEPFTFTLGIDGVIAGWEIGLKLLNEGSKATFILPSYLAYGFRGTPTIPPNTVLLFEVELISINN